MNRKLLAVVTNPKYLVTRNSGVEINGQYLIVDDCIKSCLHEFLDESERRPIQMFQDVLQILQAAAPDQTHVAVSYRRYLYLFV